MNETHEEPLDENFCALISSSLMWSAITGILMQVFGYSWLMWMITHDMHQPSGILMGFFMAIMGITYSAWGTSPLRLFQRITSEEEKDPTNGLRK